MVEDEADDFISFRNVRVIRSTAPALFCGVGDKRVWLPRRHISGRLWRRGDQGLLLIRRWVARDRHLVDSQGGATVTPVARSLARRRLASLLHLVPSARAVSRAD